MPLTIKLDDKELTLSDECLKAMAATLWHTRVKERGFMLCQDTEINPSPEHIGGKYSIGVRNCRGRPVIGHYHTHPLPGTSRPSWWDALSIVSSSHLHMSPWLGCRGAGAKYEEEIRCDTVKELPSFATVQALKRKRAKMKFLPAETDPEIWQYFTEPYIFPARKVPEIIKPPVPVPAVPRIKTEELVFASSAFKKYTNLDTGETWTERLY